MREYFAEGVTATDVGGKARRRMDGLDCHNRSAHRFSASPERDVDGAIPAGEISTKIPFIRRQAVRALRGEYPPPKIGLGEIDRSVFPGMKVGWGAYPNQIGHTTSMGCFRCHDEGHETTEGLAIRQDRELCHTIE